jgi:membrane protein DedA with SNARE-associated domain
VPLSEDLILIVCGFLCYKNVISIGPTWGFCMVGVLAGDFILYYMGRTIGADILKKRFLRRWISRNRLAWIRLYMKKHGNKTILVARHMPGIRSAVIVASGMFKMKPRVFFFWDALGASLSVTLMLLTSYLFATRLHLVIQGQKRVEHFLIIGAITVAAVLFIRNMIKKWRQMRRPRGALSHNKPLPESDREGRP